MSSLLAASLAGIAVAAARMPWPAKGVEMTGLRRRTFSGLTPFAAVLMAGVSFAARHVEAQSYRVLQEFEAQTSYRAGLILGLDGRLYGTSDFGGPRGPFAWGTVFSMDADGDNYSVLHAFEGSGHDRHPSSRLIQTPDGSLYGTAAGGGGGAGAIFRIDPQGQYTVLHAFSYSPTPPGGANPSGLTLASDGLLYGTTRNNGGTVFRISTDGSDFTVIHDGYGISNVIQASDGRLYGATVEALYRLDLDGGNYEVIRTFNPQDWWPSDLIEVSGVLYGVSLGGGTNNLGFLYRLDLDGGNYEVLHDFEDVEGQWPRAALFHASDGLLYGTTSTGGGQGFGTVFKLETSGANFSVIHQFDGRDGGNPAAPLMESAGFLYGTTVGIVYRLALGGGSYSVLHGSLIGAYPAGGLVQDSSGFLYGTASGGGAMGTGTVIKIDPSGVTPPESLHVFVGTDGYGPSAALLLLPDGDLYGSALGGGSTGGGAGVLFKLGTDGNDFSLMHAFNAIDDGSEPIGRLVPGDDGALYGATYGNTSTCAGVNCGSVFKIDTDGSDFTNIHNFSGADGQNPSGLMQGSDGDLYGATLTGVDSGSAVFRMTTAGDDFTVLREFTPEEGAGIMGSLIEGADGYLYGATRSGGPSGNCRNSLIGCGALFKMEKTGANFSQIHAFNGVDGALPSGGLLQASDGFLYGLTEATGCDVVSGTLYRIATDGSGFEVLHRFIGMDGSGRADTRFWDRAPVSELLEGADGALYGTTFGGGSGYGGVVFRLDLATTCAANEIQPDSGPSAGGTAFTLLGAGFQDGPTLTLGGVEAGDVVVTGPTELTGTSPALEPGTLNDLFLRNPDGTLATLPDAWFADFADVPEANLFHDFVESLFRHGVTAGCGVGTFCPDNLVTRAQMAVFLLKAIEGGCYDPVLCTGVFGDVACSPTRAFAVQWIEELHLRGITAGCNTSPLLYCPDEPVRREQMAVFILKAKHGSGYAPPPCTGVFEDVLCPSPYAAWIEQLAAENITAGCQENPPLYCPASSVTRAQMATFLVRAFLAP
jgi:uncharacterized repeat protein (TIGR03803 family)